jgi:hypothetical protein
MNRFVLVWEQFDTFQAALKKFKRSACLYVLTDKEERILRIGESGDLRSRYRGGTGWMVEAALHESGNKIFVAPAPADEGTRRAIEAWLTFKHQPRYCQRDKCVAPVGAWHIEHTGRTPQGFAALDSQSSQQDEGRNDGTTKV